MTEYYETDNGINPQQKRCQPHPSYNGWVMFFAAIGIIAALGFMITFELAFRHLQSP